MNKRLYAPLPGRVPYSERSRRRRQAATRAKPVNPEVAAQNVAGSGTNTRFWDHAPSSICLSPNIAGPAA